VLYAVCVYAAKTASHSCGVVHSEDGIPVPLRVLCPLEVISFEWPPSCRIGAGLANLGNTCFLNATLQCLTHTAPLVNYLRANGHRKHCTSFVFYIYTVFQKSSTPAHIDNSVNSQRIFKFPSLSLFGKFGIKESF